MNLDDLRNRIDDLDHQIVESLNERARCAQQIGDIKRNSNAPIYVPEREKEVFGKLAKLNEGPLAEPAMRAIYREIISAIRSLEKVITVAFLGPRDTFSHIAALRVFGAAADYRPLPTIPDIFTEVERARLDYGVVPVESSMGGAVLDTLDRFMDSNVVVINEVMIHVTQNLLGNSPIGEIRRVYSKDNALLQCRQWLRSNLPAIEQIELASTAEAARRAAEEPGAAAIASRLAAVTYNLNILAESIEDMPQNYTRFLIIGRQMVRATGNDKTSILISVKDRPGALFNLLVPFADADVSLTRIESRPSRQKPWEYVFFIDLLGHADEPKVKEVLDKVADLCTSFKLLGSFPRAELPVLGQD
jgi:chorismate mutase/prephenate dehydratase